MDKGVKGLLTGDLSVPLLMEIDKAINRYQVKFNKISSQTKNLLDK